MTLLLAVLFGLIVGSFLNVCIVRLPEEESIVAPRSHCRSCDAPVAWNDNIPVASFLLLGGRCRSCGAPFSIRYPLVEVLAGIFFGMVAMRGLPPAVTLVQMAIVSVLIVVTFIDIDHFLILDVVTYPSIALSPVLALVVGHITIRDCLLGIVVGGGGLWAFAWTYEKLRHREGMGFGDVKLLAMIGGLLGWQATLFSLFAASLVGSAWGLVVMVLRSRRLDLEIPFGPFLALGAVIYMFDGPRLIALWLERPPLF
ncbi:MAG TPA: prepilin peptidase [Candidatus Binatia bacterium]|jgi:leader peptidase (prepilin peptidase)/N-methyltransferase